MHRVLVGQPEGKRPVRRPRHRRGDNIKRDLQKIGGDLNLINLAKDRDRWWAAVNTVMNLRFP